MARIDVVADIELDSPTLVEGLPGVGLVGKTVADHLVNAFEMEYYAGVHCDGVPQVGVYRGERSALVPPVRLHADPDRNLVVLQSDVPVSPSEATAFAACVTGWLDEHDVTPIYLSGLPDQSDGPRELYGVSTGNGDRLLDDAGIVPPAEGGLVSGPTGALLYHAGRVGLDGVGLIVETNPQFPDPEAARVVLEHGVAPIADVEVETQDLTERAEEIREARERLAERMAEAEDESSQAEPLRMFQ
ncbi:proteasome assembly chaperone family protein [Halococcus sp. IIIV-5B]|uniref:proteasome assembly chaperone family protein n=1 Tax=Halococcus sp. IIIV-5B TaxID=2321230 RepID=UPI000E71DF5B|nr:PAC2 family protein [Halococcus sp. IIIV-5B]RJT03405.1 proteasome assembly chaperone family protein [Halococcus sp. IIIV-5B]